MGRIRLNCPEPPRFYTEIPVLIQHINYGGHLGNDAVLALAQEARIRYLKSMACSELDACGVGLIMRDAAVVYKSEGFAGDLLKIGVVAGDITKWGFDLYYMMTTNRSGKEIKIAEVKTGMVCFDYAKRKPVSMPNDLRKKLSE